MRIKVVNSITDLNGDQLPYDMIGKEYDVVKEEVMGVWVTEGKLDVFVQYDELEILELSDDLSTIFGHYLRNLQKNQFHEDLKRMGCNHLI